jgi:hypothetical protein
VNKPETLEDMLEQMKDTSYTKRLAKSMGSVKTELFGTLLFGGFRDVDKPYEIEVNFDD